MPSKGSSKRQLQQKHKRVIIDAYSKSEVTKPKWSAQEKSCEVEEEVSKDTQQPPRPSTPTPESGGNLEGALPSASAVQTSAEHNTSAEIVAAPSPAAAGTGDVLARSDVAVTSASDNQNYSPAPSAAIRGMIFFGAGSDDLGTNTFADLPPPRSAQQRSSSAPLPVSVALPVQLQIQPVLLSAEVSVSKTDTAKRNRDQYKVDPTTLADALYSETAYIRAKHDTTKIKHRRIDLCSQEMKATPPPILERNTTMPPLKGTPPVSLLVGQIPIPTEEEKEYAWWDQIEAADNLVHYRSALEEMQAQLSMPSPEVEVAPLTHDYVKKLKKEYEELEVSKQWTRGASCLKGRDASDVHEVALDIRSAKIMLGKVAPAAIYRSDLQIITTHLNGDGFTRPFRDPRRHIDHGAPKRPMRTSPLNPHKASYEKITNIRSLSDVGTSTEMAGSATPAEQINERTIDTALPTAISAQFLKPLGGSWADEDMTPQEEAVYAMAGSLAVPAVTFRDLDRLETLAGEEEEKKEESKDTIAAQADALETIMEEDEDGEVQTSQRPVQESTIQDSSSSMPADELALFDEMMAEGEREMPWLQHAAEADAAQEESIAEDILASYPQRAGDDPLVIVAESDDELEYKPQLETLVESEEEDPNMLSLEELINGLNHAHDEEAPGLPSIVVQPPTDVSGYETSSSDFDDNVQLPEDLSADDNVVDEPAAVASPKDDASTKYSLNLDDVDSNMNTHTKLWELLEGELGSGQVILSPEVKEEEGAFWQADRQVEPQAAKGLFDDMELAPAFTPTSQEPVDTTIDVEPSTGTTSEFDLGQFPLPPPVEDQIIAITADVDTSTTEPASSSNSTFKASTSTQGTTAINSVRHSSAELKLEYGQALVSPTTRNFSWPIEQKPAPVIAQESLNTSSTTLADNDTPFWMISDTPIELLGFLQAPESQPDTALLASTLNPDYQEPVLDTTMLQDDSVEPTAPLRASRLPKMKQAFSKIFGQVKKVVGKAVPSKSTHLLKRKRVYSAAKTKALAEEAAFPDLNQAGLMMM